jgi:hypothetical protein
MIRTLRQTWRDFEESVPGKRFQERFERRQRSEKHFFQKALSVGGGILIMAAGLFFLAAPGPGVLVLLVGAGLIAQESFHVARALDWLEVRLRKLVGWSLHVWRHCPLVLKIAIVFLAIALLVAAAFGTYQLLIA